MGINEKFPGLLIVVGHDPAPYDDRSYWQVFIDFVYHRRRGVDGLSTVLGSLASGIGWPLNTYQGALHLAWF